LQADIEPHQGTYRVRHGYYDQTALPAEPKPNLVREDGTLEYVHRWEELIGAMCAAGFSIEALTEPMHAKRGANAGSFGHRSSMIPPYVRIKARRNKHQNGASGEPLIIA